MIVSEKKAQIDWELIERDYRAGVLSVREIAASQGITHGAIGKRAARDLWVRSDQPKGSRTIILEPRDELASAGFIYVIFIETGLERFYKIGMAKSFGARFDQHQCSSPFDIKIACAYFVGNMRAEERHLHAQFSDKRVRGEWFRLSIDDLRWIASKSLLVDA